MTGITVDQSKLILNAFNARLQNKMQFAECVTFNELDGEMNDLNSLTVADQVVPRYTASRTVNGVKDLTSGVQATVFGSEQYTINSTFNTSMGYSDWQKIRDLGSARNSEALQSCTDSMSEAIETYLAGFAAKMSNNWVGDAGATIDDPDEIASAITRMAEEGNTDADVKVVINFTDKQKLGAQIRTLAAPDALVTGSYRKGFTGEIQGVQAAVTQNLAMLKTGTRSGGTVASANSFVDYKDVCISAANGQFKTQLLNLTGLGANATVKEGDVFTIAGVGAYDQRKQAPIGRSQQFVVTSDVTADGSGNATVRIYPAIIIAGQAKTSGQENTNTAQATCDAIPAQGAVISWKGAADTYYMPRLLIDKKAIQVNTKELIMPFNGVATRKKLSKFPISVRMWQYSDPNTGEHRVRFDTALTANIKRRDCIIRLNGVG